MLWWWNATKTPGAKSAWTYTAHSRFYCALLLMWQIDASNETKVSLCCSVCKHGDCLLCGKIREVIKDSLRKNRNTKDLAGLPRVLLNSLVIYQNDSLCCLRSKKKKKTKRKDQKKKKIQPSPKSKTVRDKCACTIQVREGQSLRLPLGSYRAHTLPVLLSNSSEPAALLQTITETDIKVTSRKDAQTMSKTQLPLLLLFFT